MDQHVFENPPRLDPAASPVPAQPLVFGGLAGFYHPAGGRTAVLLLSPWGYEELCSRKSYRMLGEKLSAAGFPCLRFDYPATGHSAGSAPDLDDNGAWRTAVKAAFAELKRLSGLEHVIVAGQGIGAALAADLAQSEELAGLVVLAPVLQGRAYLRELAAWTAMTQPTFLVKASDGPDGGLMAGGFVLSRATAEEFKSLNLLKASAPRTEHLLLVDRPDHPGDQKLAEHYAAEGVAPERMAFEGYLDYVADPTLSVAPEATLDRIVDWVKGKFPQEVESAPAVPEGLSPDFTPVAGVKEELVRFGPDDMFFGVFAQPESGSPRSAVLILNSGYDHSIGWARMAVGFARQLAANGSAVLRVDLAGIGESRYWPGQPGQVLYSDRQVDDVSAAIDWLTERLGVTRVILSGRCSGAYLALLAAARDERVNGAFLINPRRLVWDPDEDVDQAIREPIQTLETYSRKMFDRETARRVLSGEINPVSAARKVATALSRKADMLFAPVLRPLSKHHRLSSVLGKRLAALNERGVPVQLVYSEGDRGLGELGLWFGQDRKGLSKYSNVTVGFIADADHNLTPLKARAEAQELLLEFAGVGAGDTA
ncbi:alpha/beta fold hydrolase [Roseibium sp. Sym1]|uniref:alpha/beta fold hydrolase n=1 Tax=Roseibium sp. Sym1 TaxID=3016006 RepID=UPI0022B3A999|nr:alpha/beta fold hydrolase [Roseibium sp. Sym1]